MIEDHPHLGKEIEYPGGKGTITGVRSRSLIYDKRTNKYRSGIQFRIKPADGSRAFWTGSMLEDEP